MILQSLLGYIIASILIQAPILWLAGRIIVGSERARFMDAVLITILAVLANAVIGVFLGQTLGGLSGLLVYLFLIVRYYETDWIRAGIIAVLNTIIGWIIVWIMVVIMGMTAIF
jgi:hypothetical protein